MSKAEIANLRKKILKGLKLARKKAIENAIAHNTDLVFSENGKIKLVNPKKIK